MAAGSTNDGSSVCPPAFKIAAFNNYVYRLVKIPMERPDLNNGDGTLKHLVILNNLNNDLTRMICTTFTSPLFFVEILNKDG